MTRLPSYSSGPSVAPLLGDTIGANLRRTTAQMPRNEALVDVPSGRRWTYAALASAVDRLAGGLLNAGIEAGDRVGIWAPNCPESFLLAIRHRVHRRHPRHHQPGIPDP